GLYQNWPSDVMPDILIGNLPSKATGLAITDTDELLVSAQGQTSLQVYNTQDQTLVRMRLNLTELLTLFAMATWRQDVVVTIYRTAVVFTTCFSLTTGITLQQQLIFTG